MDFYSHNTLQSDCSKCKSLGRSCSSKYSSENVIGTENDSAIVLNLKDDDILRKKFNINNEVDSNIIFSSPSTAPTCSTNTLPVASEQSYSLKVTQSDQQIYDRILTKLNIAYENLCPVIDEIISNATEYTASNQQSPEYSEGPVCSVTQEQYIGAIKASRLIQEIQNDVIQNGSIDMELLAGDINLPAADFMVHSAQQSIYSNPSPGTPITRIYIEKKVVNQLIELYQLLHGALQQLSEIAKDKYHISRTSTNRVFSKKFSNVFKLPHTSKNQFKVSNSSVTNNPENDLLLIKLQEEYQGLSDAVDMLKSIVKETSGSIGDIKKLRKTLQAARKTKSDNSVLEMEKSKKITDASGARRCILECLVELAEVRKYLKNLDNTKDSNEVSQICLTAELKRECCSKKHIPHLHAKLNGIPIVVKLNQVLGF